MSTGNEIIELALEAGPGSLGVGQSVLPETRKRAESMLNMMLAQWSKRRWLVYHLVSTDIASTGAASYTIGSGGDFDITRTDKIESAFARQHAATPNPVDYPLRPIISREDYNRISLKSLATFPRYYFFDSGYPTGSIYFWPIPSNLFRLFISTKEVLTAITDFSAELNLPPEYEEALWSNLAKRLCARGQRPLSRETREIAEASLATIRAANLQMEESKMPDELVGVGNYNVYSDQSY